MYALETAQEKFNVFIKPTRMYVGVTEEQQRHQGCCEAPREGAAGAECCPRCLPCCGWWAQGWQQRRELSHVLCQMVPSGPAPAKAPSPAAVHRHSGIHTAPVLLLPRSEPAGQPPDPTALLTQDANAVQGVLLPAPARCEILQPWLYAAGAAGSCATASSPGQPFSSHSTEAMGWHCAARAPAAAPSPPPQAERGAAATAPLPKHHTLHLGPICCCLLSPPPPSPKLRCT